MLVRKIKVWRWVYVCFRRCDVTAWCHQININRLLILWCKSFEFSHEWDNGEEKMYKWKPKCHSGCSSLSFSCSLPELDSFFAASTRWCTKSSVQKLSIKPSRVPAPYSPEVQWPRSGRSPEAPPPRMSEQQQLKEWRTQHCVCLCVYVCLRVCVFVFYVSTFALGSADVVHVHLWLAAHRDTTVLHRKPQLLTHRTWNDKQYFSFFWSPIAHILSIGSLQTNTHTHTHLPGWVKWEENCTQNRNDVNKRKDL